MTTSIALVTGATRGIGREIAAGLAGGYVAEGGPVPW
jgi:NAD(P)-dependent dehydrogenase (short-subunit alcohol dehydrogenase family)